MASDRKPLQIGPFAGGLNLYDDPTAIQDTECVEALNFEPGLNGSLMSRPPFQSLNTPLPLGTTGNALPLGVYYAENGQFYLLATDGLTSTYYYAAGAWTLITNTFAASSFAQFNGKAWLVSPIGEADPGGYWDPTGGFVADVDMPHGDVILSYNFRLWIARGKNATQGTRIHYSKVLGQPNFWVTPGFIDVGAGDGQSVVALALYYNSLIVFRTRSIYTLQYVTDPAQSTVQVLIPGVGLENKYCIVPDENYIYFFYDGNAYQFINNQVQQINQKVPFEAESRLNIHLPLSVSVFGKRVLYSFYDTMYLFSLRTRTWTRWRSKEYGAIGKIVSPVSPNTEDAAYALSSQLIPPPTVWKNYCVNPWFPVDTQYWQWPVDLNASRVTTPIQGMKVDIWSTTSDPQVQYGSYNMNGFTVGETLRWRAGLVYTNSAFQWRAQIIVKGAVDYTHFNGNYVNGDGESMVTMTIPPGTTEVFFRVAFDRPTGGSPNEGIVIGCSIDKDVNLPFWYFDGDSGNNSVRGVPSTMSWEGTRGASVSLATTRRSAPLLFIREGVDTSTIEKFDCIIQTKYYNYELPSNFKRLFWWGVDAIFKGAISGEAIPIVYNQKPTWGQLRSQGITWHQLLNGTWGSPLSVPTNIETGRNLGNLGPTRKFVKFRKGLRFRQIGFRVTFPVDGTSKTLPVYVFSITAHIVTRETVVKAIS